MDSQHIEQRLNELRNRKDKNAFLESIMNAPTATVIHETNGHKTIMFPRNKGTKTKTWHQTKKMAFELNEAAIDVAFLSEPDGVTCADSILRIGNIYRIADFKYCITTNPNTLAKELEHGFEQASTLVLKLRNMDVGTFRETIEYLLRNEKPFGNIILINRYGKVVDLLKKEIKTGIYKKIIKGFL